MLELWTNYGFYLWALTTALVVISLAWLAWSTFTGSAGAGEAEVEAAEAVPAAAPELGLLEERVAALAEAAPHMQASLGRALQFSGLVRFTDNTGAQAFSLSVANARGDGFVLSSSVRGGLTAKPLASWASNLSLSHEEQAAIDQARQHYQSG